MKKPTAAQLAARKKFAEMARSGALAKKRKAAVKKTVRAKNPINKWCLYYKVGSKSGWKKSSVSTKTSVLPFSEIAQYQYMFAERNQVNPNTISLKLVSDSGTEKIIVDAYKTNPTAKKKTVSQKISQLRHEGYPQKQAVAVALSEQRAGKVKRNPTKKAMHMYTVHRTDANGNPVYHIAHFRNLKDAKEYAHAYANAHGKMIAITKKAI